MPRRAPSTPAIWAVAVVATGLAMECHEWAHVVAGRAAGGHPTLITTTETKGDFSSLTAPGFVALGGSGFAANLVLALLGWWILRRRPLDSGTRLFGWFTLSINLVIIGMGMLAEAAAGFGDWMTILQPWPGSGILRLVVTVLGVGLCITAVRVAGRTMGGALLPDGDRPRRRAEALRIVLHGAAAATLLALGGALAYSREPTRSTLLGVGASLGPFLLLLSGVRHALRVPADAEAPALRPASPLWFVAALAVTGIMWVVLGPGVTLAGG